ncbi:VOC family protein [Phytohabitans rumicis]|nr:VOC family protein [Phytohabitans rumicis]
MTAIANLVMVNIDGPDPAALARFYHQVLGWEVTHSEHEYAMISDGTTSIGFGRVEDYQPPAWPNPGGTKQFHLDVGVEDLDKAEELYLAAGATKPEFQPGGERWRVLIDPAGHPFCICPRG